jgi:GntR family transcriptional regulator, transcriptional repressor for pyruvate dehydrogenase complex
VPSYSILSDNPPSPRTRLGAIERQPKLSDKVADSILELIRSRRLTPGDALPSERELGEQFGVSRTVIREAVRALDAKGLLDVRTGSRTRIGAVDATTVRESVRNFVRSNALPPAELTELREALGAAAARLAATRATEADLDRARVGLERRTPAGAELSFDRAVVAAAHNELLLVLTDAVADALADMRPVATLGESGQLVAHRVLAAVAGGEAEDAQRLMREYLGGGVPGTGTG